MGQLCQGRKEEQKQDLSDLAIELLRINNKIIQQMSKITSPYFDEFLLFHESELKPLLFYCSQPQKQINFQSLPEMQNEDIQHPKLQFYIQLKEKIDSNKNSLFNLILGCYFVFLSKFMQFGQKKTTKTTTVEEKIDSNVENSNSSYCNPLNNNNNNDDDKDKDKDKDIMQLKGYRSKSIAELLIQQMNGIFTICRQLIYFGCQQQLQNYFGTNLDNFPQMELLIQRLIQHYLLGKKSPLKQIYNCLINSYYSDGNLSLMHLSMMPEKGTILDTHHYDISDQLLPVAGEQANISNDSFLESSGASAKRSYLESSIKSCQQKHREVKELLLKTQQFIKTSDIPYAQTFPVLTQLVTCTKPWKKFLLIEKFDRLVSKIFLVNRSTSKLNDLEELLSAEDSKSEIYIFIIHQYSNRYKVKYSDILYNSLRVMNDFDGLLHGDVKYIFCPFFLRFFTLLDMYVAYEEQTQNDEQEDLK